MLTAAVVPIAAFSVPGTAAAESDVTISHYFTGDLGKAAIDSISGRFAEDTEYVLKDSLIDHEEFKVDILVRAAGQSMPDVFSKWVDAGWTLTKMFDRALPDVLSYWAGARVQFLVDTGSLTPIDDLWAREGMDDIIAKSIADSATMYDGNRYLIPAGYHYAGMFYNRRVMDEAGITEFPSDWASFLELCENLKGQGVTPIALGSKSLWPAQFWFDYLILRTAGPDYRTNLMNGSASYDDPEVINAMAMWADLVDRGCFVPDANADEWTDAADRVERGEAAMTLMGTWITGYWNSRGLLAGKDYDFFEFPAITEGVPNAVVGPVDGWVILASAKNVPGAEAWLTYFIKNMDAQVEWASVQGALSGNVNMDPTTYTSVMQKASETVAAADAFAFNYDLATPPPVADVGLAMFGRFMDDPSDYETLMVETQVSAQAAFRN